MSDALTRLVVWLNAGANALGGVLLAPLAVLPGWLSAALVAAATGLLMLLAFKYTSHQRAVKAVRNDIKAQLLALKLFKDSTAVALRAQGRLLWGAVRLLALAVVPMLVMLVPFCLILGQLSLWCQARPLQVGEEAVVTVKLADGAPPSGVRLLPGDAAEVVVGPVRVLSERELCWAIRAREAGYHRLVFEVGGRPVEKELAVGDGPMRVSAERPGWSWSDALQYPAEEPFGPDSPVRSIEVEYRERSWWPGGSFWWVVYWILLSMVAALFLRRFVNVSI